jgi:thiamine biosynthesis protein ThiS
VEVNQALAPKRERDAIELREGDAVEIVTLVGGG